LQKMRESFRISPEQKEELKRMKKSWFTLHKHNRMCYNKKSFIKLKAKNWKKF
jgi:DNA-binding PadR family transcriptional regulator